MTTKIIQNLAYKFGLNCFIVKSWLEQGFFSDQYTGEEFFKENIDFIKAKPFVKWVGGKRQLLNQFEKICS